MSGRWHRDPAEGDVWLADPEVTHSPGPERVAECKPPKGWEAPRLLGFGAREGEEAC